MAADPDLTWQTLVYAAVAAAVAPVAAEVHTPHDLPLPFVRLGETTVSDSTIGHEILMDVHTFSSAEGSHETKTLMHKVREALHAQGFSGGGYTFTCCREENARVFFDAENETWHGVQDFRVLASLV